jgi:chromosome segregation ATPase
VRNCYVSTLNLCTGRQKSFVSLENKHHDLGEAFKEKSKALQETQAKYQALKAQLMTAEQQYAASDEAEQAIHANLGQTHRSHLSHSAQGYPSQTSAPFHHQSKWQTKLPRPIHEMSAQGSHLGSQAQS